jgi:ribonuclease HI
MQKITIHTDGGARNNPGPAGIGVVIESQGNILKEISEYIGEQTNNFAEYEALIKGLEAVKELSAGEEVEIVVTMDSELVVKQCRGEYKIKEPSLRAQHLRVSKILEHLPNVSFVHVRREQNSHADELVNRAVDEALKKA